MALDEAALTACYRRLERPLFNVVYRLLWDTGEAQDVLHEAFMKLWQRRAMVDVARIEALVYTTALNLARNRLRWRSLRQWLPLSEPNRERGDEWSELRSPDQVLAEVQVRRALAALPRASREVLLLSEFAGMDTAEIAALLGIPPGTVGSRKNTALRRLRERLEVGDES